jgi:copper chaperone CopZ
VVTVRNAVLRHPGVIDAEVSLSENLVRLRVMGGCDVAAVVAALKEIGYEASTPYRV